MTEESQPGLGSGALRERLCERITSYLTLGGLFNAELMNHDAVRELLSDCRVGLSLSSPIEPPRPARTVGCTASDDCVHECPVSEPESRLDEFKTTVIALWDPELTPEQKKAYIASRGKELREVAALATPSPQAPQRVRWTVEQNGRSERILCRWYEKDGIQLKREVAVFCDWNAAADIKWDEEDLVCTMNDYPRALAKSITSPEAQSLASLASEIVRGLEHRGHMDLYFNKDEAACAKEFVKEVMEEYLAVPHSGEVGVTQEPVGSGATLDLERSEGLYLKFSEPMMEPHTPVVIERVNGDCTVSQFIIARDEAHELINQLCEFLRVGSPRKVGEDGALRERLIALQLAHTTRYTARGNDMLWECSCGVPSKDLLGWDECHIATREHWADVMLAALSLSSPIEPPRGAEQLLNEFIGYISVEYQWQQERWENCQKLAKLFLAALPPSRQGAGGK